MIPQVFQSKKLKRNEDVTYWCIPEKSDNKSIINYSTLYSSEPGIVPGSFLYASILGVYYIIGRPFWVQQTGHPNYLVLQMIFATFAAWREIYNAINNIHLRERTLAKAQRAQENGFIRHFEWLPFVAVCSVFVTFIADKVINLVCGVFIFAVHAISRVTIYCCVVNSYIYHCR